MEQLKTNQGKPNSCPTQVFALGGIEEIGKNMYIVEHDNELFIIDCGLKFSDEDQLPGVDCIICPFDYLVQNQNKVKGLIITHAHEDHIGGVPYLLKTVKIDNVYASNLATAIIKRKLKEHSDIQMPQFLDLNDKTKIVTKYFQVEFFRVCHSIPLSFGAFFKTPNGTIATCGDFRFDFSNKMDQTDIHHICSLAKNGVDLLMCETTNSQTSGFSVSEKVALDTLKQKMMRAKGRVLITTFASNLGRIENIIEIAVNLGRKISIIGKSMDANINASINCGLLHSKKTDFIEPCEINKVADNQIVIILTGSQGEPNSALNMMAHGKYPHVVFKPSDTLLMSSNPIPGNFLQVQQLLNQLYKTGINIFVNSSKCKLHASGHATQTELHLMIKLMRPKYLIPIHGEYKMLHALGENMDFLGFKKENFLQIVNGQKVNLLNGVAKISDEVIDSSEVYVEGKKINSNSAKLLAIRKRMATQGIFSVTILINRQQKKLFAIPALVTRGCFYANSCFNLISKMSYTIRDQIEQEMQKNNQPILNQTIKTVCEKVINFYIWTNKHKNPLVKVNIFDVGSSAK